MKILQKLSLLLVAVVIMMGLSACDWFKSDEEIVKNMMTKMAEVESYSNQTAIQGNLTVPTGEELSFSVNMFGESISPVFGENHEINKAGEIFYNFTGTLSTSGVSNEFDIDLKMVDKEMYIRVNVLALLEAMGGVTDQWYRLDLNEMSQMVADEESTVEQAKFTELMAYAYELYDEHQIFTVKDDLGSEKVGKHSTYKYQLDINKEEFVNLVTKLMTKMVEEENTELPAEYQTQLTTSLQQTINNINFNNLEFNIGKKDSLLYKSIIDFTLNTDNVPELAGGSVSLKIESEYDDFNKIDNIEAPAESKSLNELMSGMMIPSQDMGNEIDSENMDLEEELTPEEQQMVDDFLEENPDIELK